MPKLVACYGGLKAVDWSYIFQNHPLTDVPCFWVHPCNSPEAIRNVLGGIKGQVSAVEYLMLWIGVVGSAVGLSLPKEMVPKRRKVS